jgi:predicted transposase/invertase (TIGR01784 family)
MDTTKVKYLNPKNDLTFRRIFGEHPQIMKSFLNSILPLEDDLFIESLTYENPAMLPVLPELKHSIVDVKCTDNKGRKFIVEMQMYWTNSFKNRMLFNAGKAYVKQLDKGHVYNELCPVYGLSLVDDIYLKDEKLENNYYHHYKLLHQEITNEQIEGIELIFIELPKFKPNNYTDKKIRNLWLRFLTEIDENTQELSEEFYNEEFIKQALEQLQVSAFTKEELEYYDQYWDKVRIEKAAILDALKREEKAIIALAQKDKELVEKDKELVEKDKKLVEKDNEISQKDKQLEQEHQNLIETAKLLKNLNISIETICEKTKLTPDEIKKL